MAQPAHLVKDIETAAAVGQVQANDLFAFGSSVFFGAGNARSYEQLWSSDGTAQGTRKIRDFDATGFAWPGHFTALGDEALFFTGRKLWRMDAAGAVAFVHELPAEAWRTASLDASVILQLGYGTEIWRSDGTPDGTFRLSSTQAESGLTRVGDAVYFFVRNDVSGLLEIWSTDGTATGTGLRVELATWWLYEVATLGDGLVFVTSSVEAERPFTLWRSDGTAEGTEPLATFVGDSAGVCPMSCPDVGPGELTALGGRLYFVANDGVHGRELWRTDGTAAGTVLVSDVNSGPESSAAGLLAAGGRIYFVAGELEHGRELWSSDGTDAGTALVIDATPGPASSLGGTVAAIGDRVLFAVAWFDDIWITDGPTSAHPLADLSPGDGVGPRSFAAVPGGLLFLQDVIGGSLLWRTDGTSAGTRIVDAFDSDLGSHPTLLTAVGGRLMFSPADGIAWIDTPLRELWISDGTENGTERVAAFDSLASGQAGSRGVLLDTLFFSVFLAAEQRSELWKTNGTSAGTLHVSGTPNGAAQMTAAGATLFFSAWDDVHGNELWATDGTAEGTRMIRDIRGGRADSWPSSLVAVGNRVFFAADDGVHGPELWVSDGTEAGTTLVADIRPGPEGFTFQGMTVALGRVFLGAYDGSSFGLWTSDGTAAGTRSLGPFDPHQLTTAGDLVFFTDYWLDELWRSDGTTEGTFMVRRGRAANLVGSSSLLYFMSVDSAHGMELWRSDGSESGTKLVRDVRPGPESSMMESSPLWPIGTVGTRAVFAASDGVHGVELWTTDGSEGGTFLVQDIAPGAPSSNPSSFTATGGLVYFSADDGVTGQELWAIPESALRVEHPRSVEPAARQRSGSRPVDPRP